MHPSLAHPGDWLKTELAGPHDLAVKGLPEHLGISRQA
jgi:plasmid maintenance system antidote protein VapI